MTVIIQIPVSSDQQAVIDHIFINGGNPFFVGGIVRDAIIGRPSKDVDIEVFGISFNDVFEAVKGCVAVHSAVIAGARFPVIKVRCNDNTEMDVASPRAEVFIGGKDEFDVTAFPNMEPKDAASRRDFTMNAMMCHARTGVVFDFFGGIQDIQNKVVRHTSERFAEDPDRVIRAGRFAAQIGFSIAPETVAICQKMVADRFMDSVKAEQIKAEFEKIFKAKQPSIAFEFFKTVGWIAQRFPEIHAMIGCQQDARWHPEGDVFNHTMRVMDCMAQIAIQNKFDDDQKIMMVMAAMCHDMGKPITTVHEADGSITSRGHAAAGVPIAEAFMRSCKFDTQSFIDRVCIIVREHMSHIGVQPSAKVVRRIAARISPVTIAEWRWIIQADASGRDQGWFDPAQAFVAVAEAASVATAAPVKIIMGRHIVPFGIKGVAVGQIVDAAFEAQIEGQIFDIESGMRFVKEFIAAKK